MGSIPVGSTNTRPVAIGRACYSDEKSGSVQRRHGFRLPGMSADMEEVVKIKSEMYFKFTLPILFFCIFEGDLPITLFLSLL